MNKNIAFIVASWIAICASASDQNNGYKGTVQIGELCAQQYVPSETSFPLATASSPSYFASLNLSSDNGGVFQIFDRTKNYAYLYALKNHFPNASCSAAIVDNSRLVSYFCDRNYLWVDNIHTPFGSQLIQLPENGYLSSLHNMPNKTACVSFVYNGCVVMNLDTQQIECSFNTDKNSYITNSIPTKNGNGIWYKTNSSNLHYMVRTLGFYDIRSGKTELRIKEFPNMLGDISINPSNTRCAFLEDAKKLIIYDVVAHKQDSSELPAETQNIETAFFVHDDILIYESVKDAEGTLHTLNLSIPSNIKDISSVIPSVSDVFQYHDNTELLITSTSGRGRIDAIYDFNNKQ